MREPPPGVSAVELLTTVRDTWDVHVDRLDHVPLGFGAHHWAAYAGAEPRLFVTLDLLEPKRTAERLEAAYAGAAALRAAGLEFVLPSVPTRDGRFTVAVADRALSCTPWRRGTPDGPLDIAWTTATLGRLHAADPPPVLPPWQPRVAADFADTTAALAAGRWGPGPYGARARDAVRSHLRDLDGWTRRYHHLADVARGRPWVPTHGEPDSGNQLLTPEGRLLVDWESLKLAPRELDLRTLQGEGVETDADPEMLELFDLEWRLDEISEYAAWFSAPHTGTEDDDIAFGGLMEELERT